MKNVEKVRESATRIRKLEVQGARNTAIVALKALEALASKARTRKRKEFLTELLQAKATLFASRPTEPLMRNAIRWVLRGVEESCKKEVPEIARIVRIRSKDFLKILEALRERTAEVGARRICDGMTVFTHCHSSTVTHLLKKARQTGKAFDVVCTETRPAFQGRITATEMLKLDIKIKFIVDSAARSFMNKADITMVGADALTSEGNVVNKIGTATIALLAREARTPFYVVSELLKYDPATLDGEQEEIEERSRDEVWKGAPEILGICNPAFDVTRREFIHGIICEEGIVPPSTVNEIVRLKYPWIFQ
jgi:ribose 1,5-bisphosphate isomerase